MPDRPRTDPRMRNYRTGLLKVTRFAHKAALDTWCSEVMADTWSLEPEDFDQLIETLPVVAAPLTATIQRPKEEPFRLIVKVGEALVDGSANPRLVGE